MSKSKSFLKIVVTILGLVGFGILAVGSDDSKSSKSSPPANSAPPAAPAETKAPVAAANINLSDADAVLNAAIEIEESSVAPIWGEIPGNDEFEKNKNKENMGKLKEDIKKYIYRIDLNPENDFDVGEFNFNKKCIPLKIRWPYNGAGFIVADYNPPVLTKMVPKEQAKAFEIYNENVFYLASQEFTDRTTGNLFDKAFYLSKSKKSYCLTEPNLDNAKRIKDDIKKLVICFTIVSAWKKPFPDDQEANCLIVKPLYLYVFGSNHVIYKTFPWPK